MKGTVAFGQASGGEVCMLYLPDEYVWRFHARRFHWLCRAGTIQNISAGRLTLMVEFQMGFHHHACGLHVRRRRAVMCMGLVSRSTFSDMSKATAGGGIVIVFVVYARRCSPMRNRRAGRSGQLPGRGVVGFRTNNWAPCGGGGHRRQWPVKYATAAARW